MNCSAQTQQWGVLPPNPLWKCLKTKRGFTSTSLTSYDKQNNVFLMHGKSSSHPPPPHPALVQSDDWPAVGFP